MTIKIRDRRYSATNYYGWKTFITYIGKDIKPCLQVSKNIVEHWNRNKSLLGYATFRGLSKEIALLIVQLAKGGKVHLGINRWGDVTSYKVN